MLTRPMISRIAEDLLAAEMLAARNGDATLLPPRPWSNDLVIGPNGLGADSLELLSLAGAVAEQFHIHDTGIEDFLLTRQCFGDWVDLIVQSWSIHSGRISFRSSGSTGRPKRCIHQMADLVAETAGHAARLQPARLLSAVPAHHIYGFLFTVLLPLQTGCEVIDIRRRLPAAGEFRPGDVIVSFPDHWRFLARAMTALPAVIGVSSTSPMPTDLAEQLRTQGLTRLVEIYGSSETAGLGWRDVTEAPFTLLSNWTVQSAPVGEGVLALVGAGGTSVTTPDLVEMAGARAFRICRRSDGVVQVGGENVHPARIARTLEQHPAIAQARVRLASVEAGGRLKALIIPKQPATGADDLHHDLLRQDLEAWMAQRLRPAERPRSVTIAQKLPQSALAKDSDWMEAR